MICSWCWFIHPATAISTNRNGSRTLGIVSTLSRDLRTAVTLFHADPVFGPYGVQGKGRRLSPFPCPARSDGRRFTKLAGFTQRPCAARYGFRQGCSGAGFGGI